MKVNVNKATLIGLLTVNREAHRETFLRAMDGYQAECIRVLEKNLEHYRDPKAVRRQLYLHEQIPVDHTREYDSVIGLIKMAEGDVVELSTAEYRQFVQDDWEWKQNWTTSNSKYLGGEND